MADPDPMPAPDGAQPKAAMNYRRGGNHCGICMHFNGGGGGGKGTCPKVTPPDVDSGDQCDAFEAAAREKPNRETGGTMPAETEAMAGNLQRRGLISDKAMAGMRGRDY